jgi:hypothetical protein
MQAQINFTGKYEVYGKPSDVKKATEQIKERATSQGVPVAFYDENQSTAAYRNGLRVDRVIITGQNDVDEYAKACENREKGLAKEKEYEATLKEQLGLKDLAGTKYFARMIDKGFKAGLQQWQNFLNTLPGHLIRVGDKGTHIKAEETLKALQSDTFDVEYGTLRE